MGRTVVLEEGELNRLTASSRVGLYTGVLVGQVGFEHGRLADVVID